MKYDVEPELVTLYCISPSVNEGVTILKFKGNVVVNGEYNSRPLETRTPVIVDADRLVP